MTRSTTWNLIVFLSLLSSNSGQRNNFNNDRNNNRNNNGNNGNGNNNSNNNNRNRNDILDMEEVRFNKFFFTSSNVYPQGFKPLKKDDYPISGLTNSTLRLSDAYSVVTLDDFEVNYNVPRLISKVGGLPSHPDGDLNAPYWDLLREVIRIQKIRLQNPNDDTLFPKPARWQNANLNEVAEFVHDELPGSLQSDLLSDILKGIHGAVRLDLNIIPYRSNAMFLRKDFLFAFMNGWAMSVVGPHNFAAKWHVGRARPEEVIWLIRKGKIQGVPNDIQRDIRQMNLRSAADFTAYEEGCPKHPSWPAMHAATASTSFWMSIVMNLNDEQLCELRKTDYAISYARTIAGVHYTDDNIAGLNLAQEVLARALPRFLKEKYNANPVSVARKVRLWRFDWRNFDPENPCP